MEERRIPFSCRARRGPRRACLFDLCRLAPSTARREHDASNQNAAIDEFETCPHDVARCTRFGRVGPARRIRRAPWRTSLPSLVRTAPGDVCPRSLRSERTPHEWFVERCQTPASPSKSCPFGGRSIRPPGSPPHLSRNKTRGASAGSPLPHPVPSADREGASRCLRNVPPTSLLEALTRRCLFRFCHRHYTRVTKPMLIVLAGPGATPGWDRTESTPIQTLRAALGTPVRMRPSPT
jgi:hypothetical protein